MLSRTLSGLCGLALSTAPVMGAAIHPTMAAATAPDLTQMTLLWYAVVGVMGLLSAAGTVVAVLEYMERKKERAEQRAEKRKAGEMGGYVTFSMLLEQLKSVYEKISEHEATLRCAITDSVEEIKQTIGELRAGLNHVDRRHERLEGQLNPIALPGGHTVPRRKLP